MTQSTSMQNKIIGVLLAIGLPVSLYYFMRPEFPSRVALHQNVVGTRPLGRDVSTTGYFSDVATPQNGGLKTSAPVEQNAEFDGNTGIQKLLEGLRSEDYNSSLPEALKGLQASGDLFHGFKSPLETIEALGVATDWKIEENPDGSMTGTKIVFDSKTGDIYILRADKATTTDSDGNTDYREMLFVLSTDSLGLISFLTEPNSLGVVAQQTSYQDTPSFWLRAQEYDAKGKIVSDINNIGWNNTTDSRHPNHVVYDLQGNFLWRAIWDMPTDGKTFARAERNADGTYAFTAPDMNDTTQENQYVQTLSEYMKGVLKLDLPRNPSLPAPHP